MFIHENDHWTDFAWDAEVVNALEKQVMHQLGYLAGRMAAIGFDSQLSATMEAMTNDVVASSQIEGVVLNTEEVRSSVARKLGVVLAENKPAPSHYVEGVVEMMLDATHNHSVPLTEKRLLGWHCALFPNKSNLTVGAYRTDEMSVVSGGYGRERIHYRAPSPKRVPAEMKRFLRWLNHSDNRPSILKSAVAHLWFVSIHPFDDGNGRIGRALSDMVLAALDKKGMHFYSLNRQILKDKNRYYKILEQTQRGDGDITSWLQWYFSAVMSAIDNSNVMLSMVLRKATFWNTHAQANISERQKKVLNLYLDGYDAKLSAKNWEKIVGVSKDTALRDIADLAQQGILIPTPGRVRDIAYSINYTDSPEKRLSDFSHIEIKTERKEKYITAQYKSRTLLKDRVSAVDMRRLEEGEISLRDLAYKHFAYLIEA